jgi:2-polyprenyl-3-methyl-5-hydroxy-6-metoxy-1,4-benzoquinol methylase
MGQPTTLAEWPGDGHESVSACPACAAEKRSPLHGNLTDRNFFCAPGSWNMYRCDSCASAYLDPRPTPETIGLAYERYFTHGDAPSFASLGIIAKLRRVIANGYRNYRYGTRDYPASRAAIPAVVFMRNGKAIIDAGMRHLPKAVKGQRLLDLGCGNGMFLARAHNAGWKVVGVDFDAKAVETARSQGLDVRLGGVEVLNPTIEQFDVITMAHVIEHVHRPLEVLQACHKLLKPGGFLWLETPNISSNGHRLFGPNWHSLDPPRHLVLFGFSSMQRILMEAGFSQVETQPYRPLCKEIFLASMAISNGRDPYSDAREILPQGQVREAEKLAKRDTAKREFITVKAWKR